MEPSPLLYFSEDNERGLIVDLLEIDFKQRYDVAIWLEPFESPFKWMRSLERMLLVNAQLPDKMSDYKYQGPCYGFEKYTILLSIIFMKAINDSPESDDSDSSEENDVDDVDYFPNTLPRVDPELAYLKCKAALDEMAANEGDIMYTRIGPAMEHVLQATRAQTLYFNGNVAESKEIAANIKPVDEMSVEDLAGIEGIKAKFILSVYQTVGIDIALKACRRAEELDPAFAMWKYLTGKTLRRMRRDVRENICEEELEKFKRAVDLERNPKFIVFLAQSYQEMALSILHKKAIGTQQVLEEMFDKAADLFRECWGLKSDSAPIARRVGNGMMKMRGHHRDLSLTKEALLKAVELSPNVVTLHALGKFYLQFEQDEEKALECFRKVGSIFGIGEIIRFNLIKSYPSYDPYDHIQYWIELATRAAKRDMIFRDIGWYYLVFKNDVFNAVKFYWKILQRDFNSAKVLEFESFAFCVEGPVNMLQILVNEIKLLNINSQDCSLEKEKIDFIHQFLEKVYEKHPDLRDISPNPDLLDHRNKKISKYILHLRQKLPKQQRPFNQRRTDASVSWRVRSSESDDNNEEESCRVSRNREEGWNRNWNQEGVMRRGGNSFQPDNRGYRGGMRSDRGGGENSRFGSNEGEARRDIPNRGIGSSRFRRDEDNMNRNQSRVAGDRRQYSNNYNSNRYDTTVTDWRSRSKD